MIKLSKEELDSPLIRGLIYRSKGTLLTKKGTPLKSLKHMVLISAEQLDFLLKKSGLYEEVIANHD